ncbi:TolB family protein [Anaerotignum sp.]|uniref:TolB family protein n=1 Tax=Anaerotignum sp. TaxID=2039241 RepID=UPI0028A7C518|nr:hypothetical protein [Anaerotignum sp.]
MDDKRKNEQEFADTPVDKEKNNGENIVDESKKDVDAMGTKQAASEDKSENVDNSVEIEGKGIENPVETIVETVESLDDEDGNRTNVVDETVDNVDKSTDSVENNDLPSKKEGGVWWKVLLGLTIFAGFLGYCWYATGGGLTKSADIAITYAKDNGLYVFDLKNDAYKVNDTISNGGAYNYYYSAWGASASEDNEDLYYIAGIDADGIGTLYFKDLKNKDAEPVLISENVNHYISSTDGSQCAYLVQNNGKADLYVYNKGQSRKVAEDILQQNGSYDLSKDGSYVLFKKGDANQTALYVSAVATEEEPVKLSDKVALSFIADKNDIAYFLEQQGDSYNLYEYTFEKEPTLVAEQVTYVELMPNGQDVLYCAMRTDETPLTQLIEDDVTDLSQYDEKRQAAIEEIRSKMKDEENMEPIFQDCYVLTAGRKIKVHDTVISVASLPGESGFLVGYSMESPAPVKLSETNSFDEAMYTYYANLMYGEKEVFIADKVGNVYTLQEKNVVPTSIQVSDDGKSVAYYVPDETTGANVLKVESLAGKKGVIEIEKQVELMGFLGDSSDLVYFYNYDGGMGSIGVFKGDTPTEIDQNTTGVYFSDDKKEIYYLADPNITTGNGTLMKYNGKEMKEIDKDVFSFQYKENGKLAYLKNYDFVTGLGDLYYYDGKTTRFVDSGVTAIYMY